MEESGTEIVVTVPKELNQTRKSIIDPSGCVWGAPPISETDAKMHHISDVAVAEGGTKSSSA